VFRTDCEIHLKNSRKDGAPSSLKRKTVGVTRRKVSMLTAGPQATAMTLALCPETVEQNRSAMLNHVSVGSPSVRMKTMGFQSPFVSGPCTVTSVAMRCSRQGQGNAEGGAASEDELRRLQFGQLGERREHSRPPA